MLLSGHVGRGVGDATVIRATSFERVRWISAGINRTWPRARGAIRWTAGGRGRPAREVTLFAVLLGVRQGLLHRYTRQNRFLIGCPTTTRISPDTREVVGNYINTLVFRADLAPGSTFREAATAADRQVRSGLGKLGYPFELLTRTMNRPRTGGGCSLCRITLNLIGAPTGDPLLLLDPADGATAEFAGLQPAPYELP
ncbi:condensation domain-containing protein [Streptomyces sp. NPDC058457]|uniref:condensation domain-containing protein n=1 Tax=Streptomyces sp. NPDC058457 TaxID=3346507 RepID=UPI003666993C